MTRHRMSLYRQSGIQGALHIIAQGAGQMRTRWLVALLLGVLLLGSQVAKVLADDEGGDPGHSQEESHESAAATAHEK